MTEREKLTSQAPAVDKALDVLEFLADQPDGATMKDIAQGLDRSMNEIYRMVLALEMRRFVQKDPDTERFGLSLRLLELAHRHPFTARLVRAAQPVMEELAETSRQSCHLASAEGERITIVTSVPAPTPMGYGVKMGSSFPMLETSSGAVLSAFTRPERIERLLAGQDDQSRAAFLERFEAIRKNGCEVRQSDVADGVVNISFAVRDVSGKTIAALTVPYLRQAGVFPGRPEVITATKDAASRISAALGHNPKESSSDD